MAGVGPAVSEVLAPLQTGCKQISIGMQDVFGQSDKPKELLAEYGLDAKGIADAIKKACM